MSPGAPPQHSALNISVVSANDQTVRMQGAIARRAFSRRGACIPGHELERWRQAESELVKPLCYGLINRDTDICIGTDVAEFKEDTIEIWVSSRQITICGETDGGWRGEEPQASRSARDKSPVFHVLHLPVEVEPSAVTAKFNGSSVEICIPKAHEEQCVKASAAVAL